MKISQNVVDTIDIVGNADIIVGNKPNLTHVWAACVYHDYHDYQDYQDYHDYQDYQDYQDYRYHEENFLFKIRITRITWITMITMITKIIKNIKFGPSSCLIWVIMTIIWQQICLFKGFNWSCRAAPPPWSRAVKKDCMEGDLFFAKSLY